MKRVSIKTCTNYHKGEYKVLYAHLRKEWQMGLNTYDLFCCCGLALGEALPEAPRRTESRAAPNVLGNRRAAISHSIWNSLQTYYCLVSSCYYYLTVHPHGSLRHGKKKREGRRWYYILINPYNARNTFWNVNFHLDN